MTQTVPGAGNGLISVSPPAPGPTRTAEADHLSGARADGSGAPRYATARTLARPTLGTVTATVARLLGRELMPWQRLVADVAGEVDPVTGRMAYEIVIVTVPRQCGKTFLVTCAALQAALGEQGRAWYTAQTRIDALRVWEDAVEAVRRSPLLPGVKVRAKNGQEELKVVSSGGTFSPFTPSKEGMHGRQADRVFGDEIWAHTLQEGTALMQAWLPTTLTRPRPQIWLLSTAGTDASTWLRQLVESGRAGAEAKTAYFEWSIADDVDEADIEAVCAAHPALGYTITREAIEAGYAAMRESPGEFARAFGNRWTSSVRQLITPGVWERARADAGQAGKIAPGSAVAFGVDLAPDRSCASVVVAGADSEGRTVVELVAHRAGVDWVRDYVRERWEKWQAPVCLDGTSASRTAVDHLSTDGVDLTVTGSGDFATACLHLYDALHAETPTVRVRAHPALDAAAPAARSRRLGGAWALERTGCAAPQTPLVAAALALWAYEHPAEQPAEYSWSAY